MVLAPPASVVARPSGIGKREAIMGGAAELEQGSIFAGRYEIQRLLGQGDRKRTYLARDTKMGRLVAISFVKPEAILEDPEGTERGSGGPGESHPRAPTDPCVTVSRYTALVVLVLWRAGFTQAQCAKYRGRFPAASAMARMAFLQDRSFLYFFMDHRSR